MLPWRRAPAYGAGLCDLRYLRRTTSGFKCAHPPTVWHSLHFGFSHAHGGPSAAPFPPTMRAGCGAVVGSLSPRRAPLRCISGPCTLVSVVRRLSWHPWRLSLRSGPWARRGGQTALRSGKTACGRKKMSWLHAFQQLPMERRVRAEAHTLPWLAWQPPKTGSAIASPSNNTSGYLSVRG